MRPIRLAVALLFAVTAMTACDSDRLVNPEASAAGNRVQFDGLGSSACRNIRGTGTAVLDPSTGHLVGALYGDLTGTHTGTTTGAIAHGQGATSSTAVADYQTNEFGTFTVNEALVVAPVSPTLFLITNRAAIVPNATVSGGFFNASGYLDVSGLPNGSFEYHGRICSQ